jgi:hypothetical protein
MLFDSDSHQYRRRVESVKAERILLMMFSYTSYQIFYAIHVWADEWVFFVLYISSFAHLIVNNHWQMLSGSCRVDVLDTCLVSKSSSSVIYCVTKCLFLLHRSYHIMTDLKELSGARWSYVHSLSWCKKDAT